MFRGWWCGIDLSLEMTTGYAGLKKQAIKKRVGAESSVHVFGLAAVRCRDQGLRGFVSGTGVVKAARAYSSHSGRGFKA